MRKRIFVFGSNELGIHGGGAAKYARDHHGAVMGVGEGLTGDSYALPTCSSPGEPLPPHKVRAAVQNFVAFARIRSDLDFLVTAVGCGIAGFHVAQIAPLFFDAPDNVYLQNSLAWGLRLSKEVA